MLIWIKTMEGCFTQKSVLISLKTSKVNQQFNRERSGAWSSSCPDSVCLCFLKLILPVEGCLCVEGVFQNKVYVKEAVHKIFI